LKLFPVGFLLSSGTLMANITLPAIFSDYMVLEARDNVPLWGNAGPGEEVTVSMDGQTVKATAAADGKWKVLLNLKGSKPGPFEMTVSGKNTLKISDVVVGEVWLASGQSNMWWKLTAAPCSTVGGAEEVAHSANPMLRTFEVKMAFTEYPQDDCQGSWVIAGPETTGNFSAVGYYFAKKLQNELKVPVGFINASVGGTEIEPWTSQQAPDTDKEFLAVKQLIWKTVAEFPAKKQQFVIDFPAWLKAHNREDKPTADPQVFVAPGVSTTDWTTVHLPGPVTAPGLPANGAIWLRREITFTEEQLAPHRAANETLSIFLGPMMGFESVYWNGRLISQLTFDSCEGEGSTHSFLLPIKLFKNGTNTLAIRIFSPVAPFNFPTAPYIYAMTPLEGPWLAKAEYALPPLDAAILASVPPLPIALPNPPATPGFLFNGMINPLIPYAISGFIWYQGESNLPRAYQYRYAFPLLIEDWRRHWGDENLPFYFCQLSNYYPKSDKPAESAYNFAELREAQSMTLKLPHTGHAVLIDLGDSENVHFGHKREAGERLAAVALANTYGKKIPFSGPVYSSMKIEDGKIRVQFDHVDGGLVARPLGATYSVNAVNDAVAPLVRNSPKSELEGFAICGEDHKWVWADAKIDGNSVLVWSDQLPKPVAVRYAWADNPICNLYNAAGLPASTFRTDDFPASTKDKRSSSLSFQISRSPGLLIPSTGYIKE